MFFFMISIWYGHINLSREIDKLGWFYASFSKGGKFNVFQVLFLSSKSLLKKVSSLNGKNLSLGRKIFSFRVFHIWQMRQNSLGRVASHPSVSIPLKAVTQLNSKQSWSALGFICFCTDWCIFCFLEEYDILVFKFIDRKLSYILLLYLRYAEII